MRYSILLVLLLLSFSQCGQKTINCKIETTLGDINIELYPEQAPKTVANFLSYVDEGLYTQSSFFRACTPENEANRAIQIEVIQGGDLPEDKEKLPIEIETTKDTGLLHLDGALSMARDTPNSATCSFFICIGDQPSLDYGGARNPDGFGFAAFGKVTSGMEVALEIQKQPEVEQYLVEPVRIVEIVRMD